MLRKFILLFITLVSFSCREQEKQEPPYIDHDALFITQLLSNVNSLSAVDSIIQLGLYNLAYAALNQHNSKINQEGRIQIAKHLVKNGEFDKALGILNQLISHKNDFEVLRLRLLCTLNKLDNDLAGVFLDSLSSLYSNTKDTIQATELVLLKAYYAHNIKNYPLAIQLNNVAINNIIKHHLPEELLSVAYHRLGNSYNDIIRDHVPHNEDRPTCYKKAMSYYALELDILKKNEHQNHTRIGLNQITTAMVDWAYHFNRNVLPYYENALKELIVANDSSILITRNPIYTSIALSQFGTIYNDFGEIRRMDSVFELNKKLIDTRSYYRIHDRQSLDILEYFPQRSQEARVLYHFKKNTTNCDPLLLLNLSNSSKYTNQYLTHYLLDAFGEKAPQAVDHWILLNELKILAAHKNHQSLLKEVNLRLPTYNRVFMRLNQKKVTPITAKNLLALKEYCKTEDATIIDYQIITNNSLLVTQLDADTLLSTLVETGKALNKAMIDTLIAGFRNNTRHYSNLAFTLAKRLRLTQIKTKNIIICPDEYLERISFESLISNPNSSKNWLNQDYLSKKHSIRLIPNLNSLIPKPERSEAFKVDVWNSDYDSYSLPYNQKLITYLKRNYSARINAPNPDAILHVLAHTYTTEENNLEFRLNRDTLTVYSSNAIRPLLAILEGCSSGKGTYYKFEGSISQTRSFLYNGTPTVIYSLWDADNQSSTYLFTRFYGYINEGLNVNDALHSAKNDTRNNIYHPEWANPYYWANFQLTGTNLSFSH